MTTKLQKKIFSIMSYKYLDKINFPSDLRNLSLLELENLSNELRNKTIETVSKKDDSNPNITNSNNNFSFF